MNWKLKLTDREAIIAFVAFLGGLLVQFTVSAIAILT
jgi:hypothetical protein